MEKIMKPDTTLKFSAHKSNFFGSKSFDDSGAAQIKEFYSPKKFKAKDFFTGHYGGSKAFWMGDFKHDTKTAESKSARVQKTFDTKAMEVKTAHDAGKNYGITAFETKASRLRGRSQDKIDTQGAGALSGPNALGWHGADWQGGIDYGEKPEMTIDEVRNLLNKNK